MSSARLAQLPPYPLQDVPEIRARLAAEGRDVLDLGAGGEGFLRASLTLPAGRYAELAARLERFGVLEPSA